MENKPDFKEMNELEATGRYLLTLNNIYQEKGLFKAILYELGSTAYSLINHLGRITEAMESAGYNIGFGFDLWGQTYPLNSDWSARSRFSVREIELERIRQERTERKAERLEFILRNINDR